MLFRTQLADATWDTWMYWHQDTFYLYYLITEHSPGEGFGVATSKDGLHWTDHGPQITASDAMVYYLGTGSVWPAPNGNGFLCNYSEWRETPSGRVQNILFAKSSDLIHWHKFGDALMFSPDPRYYRALEADGARWDCIYTLPKHGGGWWGTWTATPTDRMGVGFGESADGLHWTALPAPEIDLRPFDHRPVESGALTCNNGKYYLLVGCYDHPSGMGVFVADDPLGPYRPQEKSFALLSNREIMHAYFLRFLEMPGETLVNYHALTRAQNGRGRHYTYLTPLKRVAYDAEGTLRLMWWPRNEALAGASVETGNRLMLTYAVTPGTQIQIRCTGGEARAVRVCEAGRVEISDGDMNVLEFADRELNLPAGQSLRVLASGALLELYLNDCYMLNYTLPGELQSIAAGADTTETSRRALMLET